MTAQPATEVPVKKGKPSAAAPASSRWSLEARIGGYRAFSELLREPPCEPLFVDAKASLRGFGPDVGGALGALREALEHAQPGEMLAAWNDSQAITQLTCAAPRDAERLWALVSAELNPDARRLCELDVLAGMGDRILNAARFGHTRLVEAALERRQAFLVHHGIECLGGLAYRLEHEGITLYRQVGRALAALIDAERSDESLSRSVASLAKCP